MESTIRITGKVVDTDGSPVPLAAISAIVDAKDGAGLDSAMTDKQGFFELQLPPGKAKLYFNSLPSGFEYPRPQVIKRLEIQVNQEQVEALNFVLQRTPEPDN